jgi:guanylate kinase
VTVAGRPFPLVISAPSGAGKTSLARALVEKLDDVVFSVSVTTREPRSRERSGKDYHFTDDAEFERMVESGELAEWAVVHGRRYGTPRREIARALAEERWSTLRW